MRGFVFTPFVASFFLLLSLLSFPEYRMVMYKDYRVITASDSAFVPLRISYTYDFSLSSQYWPGKIPSVLQDVNQVFYSLPLESDPKPLVSMSDINLLFGDYWYYEGDHVKMGFNSPWVSLSLQSAGSLRSCPPSDAAGTQYTLTVNSRTCSLQVSSPKLAEVGFRFGWFWITLYRIYLYPDSFYIEPFRYTLFVRLPPPSSYRPRLVWPSESYSLSSGCAIIHDSNVCVYDGHVWKDGRPYGEGSVFDFNGDYYMVGPFSPSSIVLYDVSVFVDRKGGEKYVRVFPR